MLRVLLIFFIVCLHVTAIAQTEKRAKLLTKFKFLEYSGGLVMLKAKFDTVATPLNFILDTGGGGISLDSATCDEFNIETRNTDTSLSGFGGTKKVKFVFNKSIHFPGLDVDSLNFHVNNYELLSAVYGEKIDGIIGYAFLKRFIVKLNYDSSTIEIYSPGKLHYPSGTTLRPAFTSLPIQNAVIKDKKSFGYNFYFDSGAGLCLLLSQRLVSDSMLLLPKRKPLNTTVEGIIGTEKMTLTVIKKLTLGPYRFSNVPTYIFEDKQNIINYPFIGGLLGSEIFRRFNIIINYPSREIHLSPNSNYLDPFDYAFVGMSFYKYGDKIVIDEIIAKSPADVAGLKVGDEIIGVDKNFSGSIQEYRKLFQEPNSKIYIFIRRNSQIIKIELKTKSILR